MMIEVAYLWDVALLNVAAGGVGGDSPQCQGESGGIGSDGRSKGAGRESREHSHRAARGIQGGEEKRRGRAAVEVSLNLVHQRVRVERSFRELFVGARTLSRQNGERAEYLILASVCPTTSPTSTFLLLRRHLMQRKIPPGL